MRHARFAAIIALSMTVTPAVAQAPYQDPWAPTVERAAEAAVARLGSARGLEIHSIIVKVPALTSTGS
jgi:hypothetical protein